MARYPRVKKNRNRPLLPEEELVEEMYCLDEERHFLSRVVGMCGNLPCLNNGHWLYIDCAIKIMGASNEPRDQTIEKLLQMYEMVDLRGKIEEVQFLGRTSTRLTKYRGQFPDNCKITTERGFTRCDPAWVKEMSWEITKREKQAEDLIKKRIAKQKEEERLCRELIDRVPVCSTSNNTGVQYATVYAAAVEAGVIPDQQHPRTHPRYLPRIGWPFLRNCMKEAKKPVHCTGDFFKYLF